MGADGGWWGLNPGGKLGTWSGHGKWQHREGCAGGQACGPVGLKWGPRPRQDGPDGCVQGPRRAVTVAKPAAHGPTPCRAEASGRVCRLPLYLCTLEFYVHTVLLVATVSELFLNFQQVVVHLFQQKQAFRRFTVNWLLGHPDPEACAPTKHRPWRDGAPPLGRQLQGGASPTCGSAEPQQASRMRDETLRRVSQKPANARPHSPISTQ